MPKKQAQVNPGEPARSPLAKFKLASDGRSAAGGVASLRARMAAAAARLFLAKHDPDARHRMAALRKHLGSESPRATARDDELTALRDQVMLSPPDALTS
jgi:hypothetical protein